MDFAIMIEGQNGLNWPRWQKIAQAVESLGFAGLYRSDHFTNASAPDLDSLEMISSLTWLASHTKRIEFGSLVSPFSFRHVTILARMARDIDDLSGGRFCLGVGAGWQHREHYNYGMPLLDLDARFRRFEEGLRVIRLLFDAEKPVSFEGEYYDLREASFLPRPSRPGGPPILIGGNGAQRTLPLAARYAQYWNGVYVPPARYRQLNQRLDALLAAENRRPADLHRSLMIGCVFGSTDAEVQARIEARSSRPTREQLREHGVLVGTGSEIRDQAEEFREAGAQRLMLQWLDLDDIAGLEGLAMALL